MMINAFLSDGPTVVSRPRVRVVSGALPKSDRAQERAKDSDSPVASRTFDHNGILFLGYAKDVLIDSYGYTYYTRVIW